MCSAQTGQPPASQACEVGTPSLLPPWYLAIKAARRLRLSSRCFLTDSSSSSSWTVPRFFFVTLSPLNASCSLSAARSLATSLSRASSAPRPPSSISDGAGHAAGPAATVPALGTAVAGDAA
eukprot:CAMPEP_0171114012 /NCGR_PEP_ID=MMETSP0766_2-20121228/84239_1 /TAXON_ID=439317 /ORGANISM="Gambierdiscus australes, Strain CAWD 149" /LENGTH=121 /DNA_ID=CAMNT_0011576269 /DNA_START=18 /DNA_END=378 /DNA_ORIENTATION=+